MTCALCHSPLSPPRFEGPRDRLRFVARCTACEYVTDVDALDGWEIAWPNGERFAHQHIAQRFDDDAREGV